MEFRVNDVVQFMEKHQWRGCLGIVTEVKDCGDDTRLMIGVPVPQQGVAYIYSMVSNKEVERVGRAILEIK